MDRPVRHTREAQRLINRRQQGDLGEASAIEWLTRHGAAVWTPLGHSPDADLIAEMDGRLLRVQVKTSTLRSRTPNGHVRWDVSLRTNGGNQSWSGIAKTFDPSRFDLLFVLTGGGRRWVIPADAIESRHALKLAGPRYSEFEIEPGTPIESIVYGDAQPLLESKPPQGEYPSGQRKGSVKAPANAFAGSNPASPMESGADGASTVGRWNTGQTRISSHHQIRIPNGPFGAGGFTVGDRLRVHATGAGEATIKRIEASVQLDLGRPALDPAG
jgi:Holliday junction resolvase-like predicted endonuclease